MLQQNSGATRFQEDPSSQLTSTFVYVLMAFYMLSELQWGWGGLFFKSLIFFVKQLSGRFEAPLKGSTVFIGFFFLCQVVVAVRFFPWVPRSLDVDQCPVQIKLVHCSVLKMQCTVIQAICLLKALSFLILFCFAKLSILCIPAASFLQNLRNPILISRSII